MDLVLKIFAFLCILIIGYKVSNWYNRELYKAKTGRELRDKIHDKKRVKKIGKLCTK